MYQRLQQCATIPDFNNYLAYLLTQGEGQQDDIRQTAGLLLKNNLKTGWTTTPPEFRQYIQRALLPGLGHPNRFLRHTVGTTVSVIAKAAGPAGWPDLYPALVQCIESQVGRLVAEGCHSHSRVLDWLHDTLHSQLPRARSQACV
jgi:transportin-1